MSCSFGHHYRDVHLHLLLLFVSISQFEPSKLTIFSFELANYHQINYFRSKKNKNFLLINRTLIFVFFFHFKTPLSNI